MLYSESTRKEFEARKRPVDFRHSTLGALETLTYAGRPVESLPEFRLSAEMLGRFETLVLPEVEVLPDSQTELIRQWLSNGGTVVASFKCGLLDQNHMQRARFPLADVFGLDYVGEERRYAYDQNGNQRPVLVSTYLESATHELGQMFGQTTAGLPGSFLNVNRTTASEVLWYRLPFMIEDLPNNPWYNHGPPPPGPQLGGTAVAFNGYGKGQAVFAFLLVLGFVVTDNLRSSVREEVAAATRVTVQMLRAFVVEAERAGGAVQEGRLESYVQSLGRVRSNEIVILRGSELVYGSPPSVYKAGRSAPECFPRWWGRCPG